MISTVASTLSSSFDNVRHYSISFENKTIYLLGVAALAISASLMAIYQWCKNAFSKNATLVPHQFALMKKHTLEKRIEVVKGISRKHVGSIAVIVERHFKSKVSEIENTKYVFPDSMTPSKFIYEIKQKLPGKDINLYLLNGKNEVISLNKCSEDNMRALYNKHKNEDGFLYAFYTGKDEFKS